MSNNLPAAVSKTMPTNAVVDYSGQISQTELGTLQAYASRMHYSPHVVLLPASAKTLDTEALALQIAKTWNLEPNGFLLVVNPGNNTAAMVAGSTLQSRGISGKYINTFLMPQRFEKEYAMGNTYGAVHRTMGAVEHKLNAVALQGQPAQQQQHHSSGGFPAGLIFIGFFFFFAFMVFVAGKSSVSPRRMRLDSHSYSGGESDLSADLARIHQLMGDGPVSKQIPMKEFAQRANTARSTQDSLDALPVPEHESNFPHRSSTHLTDAIERPKPLKLIFEGAHAGEKFAAPAENEQGQQESEKPSVSEVPAQTFAVPNFKPYEFPEDETVVPSVASLQPASEVAVPTPDPGLISVAASQTAVPVASDVAVSSLTPDVTQAPILSSSPSPQASAPTADLNQTTESTFKVDQFAQVMTSEPDQAAGLAAWTPAAYSLPPAPAMPEAPTLPVSHFNSSFSNDFASMLSSNSSSYGLGAATPLTGDSAASAGAPSAGVCPQCQSEKSPDFSFCLRCGHMFV